MKVIKIFFLIFCALVFFSRVVNAEEVEVEGKVKVNFLQGKIFSKGKLLALGDILSPPVEVEVDKDSRLELLLPDKSVLRFNENTKFKLVKALVKENKREIKTDLILGECWASVQKMIGDDNTFEISSPTAVAGVAGTKYRAIVNTDYSKFLVYDGKIKVGYRPVSEKYQVGKGFQAHRVQGPMRIAGPKRVSVEEWTMIVARGYEFVVYPDGRFNVPKKFDVKQDSQNPWVKWNQQRDKQMGF